jgi:hypothetical protein
MHGHVPNEFWTLKAGKIQYNASIDGLQEAGFFDFISVESLIRSVMLEASSNQKVPLDRST